MSKKLFPAITSQDEAWDDEINDIREILENQPFPVTDYADIASLPAANQNEEGLAWAQANDDADYTDDILVASDGSSWKKLSWQSAEVAGFTDNSGGTKSRTLPALTTLTDSPATADALRDELVSVTLPEINDLVASFSDAINDILVAMKQSGAMASS